MRILVVSDLHGDIRVGKPRRYWCIGPTCFFRAVTGEIRNKFPSRHSKACCDLCRFIQHSAIMTHSRFWLDCGIETGRLC